MIFYDVEGNEIYISGSTNCTYCGVFLNRESITLNTLHLHINLEIVMLVKRLRTHILLLIKTLKQKL